MHGRSELLLTSAELAARPDFGLGAALVSPSTRTISGPGESMTVEPRVMQVLVVLADAAGAVVTRDTLLQRCWGGVYVGDDSLNRAISGVRRVASQTANGSFEIETIPRTGYRLTEQAGVRTDKSLADPMREAVGQPPDGFMTSRRWLLGAAAITATIGGRALWELSRDRPDPRVAALIERGEHALRDEMPDASAQGVGLFRQAVAIEPDNAQAQGLLALALRNVAEHAAPADRTVALRAAEQAGRRALALDPKEGNALVALATLNGDFGDWLAAEDRLRVVLDAAPNNVTATDALGIMLQSVGRTTAAWVANKRAVELDPLSPGALFRLAIKDWTLGRASEAEINIERALQLFPLHPAVWNTRLFLFAFTGRIDPALAMLDDERSRPATMLAPGLALWRASLIALRTREPADIARATAANTGAAMKSPGFAVNAMMVLSVLGEVDAAFDVAHGYLLRRGPLIGSLVTGHGQMPLNDQRKRKTMMLFVPACAPMRADPRFAALCEAMGMTRYWHTRGVVPDYQRRASV